MAQTKYTVHHHDGSKEVVEDGSFDAKQHIKDMMDEKVTHIVVGGNVYHKGSIKKVVRATSEQQPSE